MSNYPDNFTGTNFDRSPLSAIDADLANDELQQIISQKQDLVRYIHETKTRFPNLQLKHFSNILLDQFDEDFSGLWDEFREKASDGWPVRIPPAETLSFVTPKQRLDREWAKNNRPVSTNPATFNGGNA